jgi:hypothetical protein
VSVTNVFERFLVEDGKHPLDIVVGHTSEQRSDDPLASGRDRGAGRVAERPHGVYS